MANPEHVEVVRQGSQAVERWKTSNPDARLDLSATDLNDVNLNCADLRGVNLNHTRLVGAQLVGADLSSGELVSTDLSHANLADADLSRTSLIMTNLSRANLKGANLTDASLFGAIVDTANVTGANFTRVRCSNAVFVRLDLSETRELNSIAHIGPSSLGIDTVFMSKGKLSDVFLRGVGLPDAFIEYLPSLAGKSLESNSAFISYSSRDDDFAKRLHAALQSNGVRCWFAPEDLKIGDKIRLTIDETIRIHDKLLVILSEHSVKSQWVEQEVETALRKEREQDRIVLFPIRLDDSVMDIESGWPALLRNTRHIGDFTKWKDHDSYQKSFERLLRDLRTENRKEPQ